MAKMGLVAGLVGLVLSGVAIATGSVLLGLITFGISTVGFILRMKDMLSADSGSMVAGVCATVASGIGLYCSYQTIDFGQLLG